MHFSPLLQGRRARKEDGFSVIEMILTVGILGILTAISIPFFSDLQTVSKQAAVEATAANGARIVMTHLETEGSISNFTSPSEALENVTNDVLGASFIDSTGAVTDDFSSVNCIIAFNKQELDAAGDYIFQAQVGNCNGEGTTPTNPGTGVPVTAARFVYNCDEDTLWTPTLADFTGTQRWSDGVELPNLETRTLEAGVRYVVEFDGSYTSTLYPSPEVEAAFMASMSCLERVDSWGTGPELTSLVAGVTGAPKVEYVAAPPSTVTNLGALFALSGFNQDINNWDVSNATNMDLMFMGTTRFNQPLDRWDTSKVQSMNSMFNSAAVFKQNLSGWDVSSVDTNLIVTNQGFADGSQLEADELPQWRPSIN